jgi:hypothetical protein
MTVNKGAKTLAKLKDMVSDEVLENFDRLMRTATHL